MNVRPTGDTYCYEVESEEHPGIWYKVDIVGNKGRGKCICVNHGVVRQPRIDRGVHDESVYCKHVKAAILFAWLELGPKFHKHLNTTNQ